MLIGFDRNEHGRPAGLRTTILVCLAAAVSMIQANLLMGTKGRSGDSFIMLDLMRLPLGVLSGMGFIGAGAILRRGDRIMGVTTAATLWYVTIMGLCFGGGQLSLGLAMLLLGLAVLAALRLVERGIKQDRSGVLVIAAKDAGPTEEAIRSILRQAGFRVVGSAISYSVADRVRKLRCESAMARTFGRHADSRRAATLGANRRRAAIAVERVRSAAWSTSPATRAKMCGGAAGWHSFVCRSSKPKAHSAYGGT